MFSQLSVAEESMCTMSHPWLNAETEAELLNYSLKRWEPSSERKHREGGRKEGRKKGREGGSDFFLVQGRKEGRIQGAEEGRKEGRKEGSNLMLRQEANLFRNKPLSGVHRIFTFLLDSPCWCTCERRERNINHLTDRANTRKHAIAHSCE